MHEGIKFPVFLNPENRHENILGNGAQSMILTCTLPAFLPSFERITNSSIQGFVPDDTLNRMSILNTLARVPTHPNA